MANSKESVIRDATLDHLNCIQRLIKCEDAIAIEELTIATVYAEKLLLALLRRNASQAIYLFSFSFNAEFEAVYTILRYDRTNHKCYVTDCTLI